MSAFVGKTSLAPGESVGLFELTGATPGSVYSVSAFGHGVGIVSSEEDTSSYALSSQTPYLTDSEILVKNFSVDRTTVAAVAIPTGISGTSATVSTGKASLEPGETVGLLEIAGVTPSGIYSVYAVGSGLSIVEEGEDSTFALQENKEYTTNGEILVKNTGDYRTTVKSLVVPTILGGGGSEGGGSDIVSVNGKTGIVVLDAEDISLAEDVSVSTYLTEYLAPQLSGAAQTAEWDQISYVPTEFPPSTHAHTIDQITGLQSDLDEKLDTPTGTASATTYARGDGTWATPTNTTYTVISDAEATTGTATTARAVSAASLKRDVPKYAVSSNTGVARIEFYENKEDFPDPGVPGVLYFCNAE